MNLNTRAQVRHRLWQSFTRSADALFELADALSSEPTARSLPESSLSPTFRRKWPSVYEALSDGRIESQHWSQVWAEALLAEREGSVWISIDATSIARPESATSADRGIIYVSNLPYAKRSVSVSWQFSIECCESEPKESGRFLKQDLFWAKAHVRTPEQFERWGLIVVTAMNQLVLSSELGQASFRPWGRRREVITPRQVRRCMSTILAQLGTLVGVPKTRGKSLGRTQGMHVAKAQCYPVIRKHKPVPKKRRKSA